MLKAAASLLILAFILMSAFPACGKPSKILNASGDSANQSQTMHKSWKELSTAQQFQMICAISAAIAFLVAEIWFIVAGFEVSVGWGLFMLLIGGMRSLGAAIAFMAWIVRWAMITRSNELLHWPLDLPVLIAVIYLAFGACGMMIFIVRHWEQARKPLAVFGLGVVSILLVVCLTFVK